MTAINFSIKAKHYKCFGEESQGFESIYPINVIIGKNNSGKSALIDIVKYTVEHTDISGKKRKGASSEVLLKRSLDEQDIEKCFSKNHSGGSVPGKNFYEYGLQWNGKPLTVAISGKGYQYKSLEPAMDPIILRDQDFANNLGNNFNNPLKGKIFRHLLAERDIKPEGSNNPELLPNGVGASNLIAHFTTKYGNDSSLVEEKLLEALNYVFAPEASFSRILSKQMPDSTWGIFLEEKSKGQIPLSDSGSGLKTVILVLANIILGPSVFGNNLEKYVFAFEELENNLHPALQRRLLTYIKEIAEKNNSIFFITTHSNIVIDHFSNYFGAQILHVTNNGSQASVSKVQTHLDAKGVLDDLDFRASDLLQSNGIVWVEGPSDRTYFNRWIELLSGGELKENVHYQCLHYGGKLLAHLTADTQNKHEVSILKINTNCVLLMDSDKTAPDKDISETKKRIKAEIESVNGFVWVTEGNEIENYLGKETIREYFKLQNDPKSIGLHDEFSDYIDEILDGEGKRFLKNKVYFSEKISPLITLETLRLNEELRTQVTKIIQIIKIWNKLS